MRGVVMSRTSFLVDGFNLYHSLKQAQSALGGKCTRWLDLRALCSSYLPHIGPTARLASIHYFSALAKHLQASKPQVTQRHLDYIACLEATGVLVELSKFKRKDSPCPHCGRMIRRHEEKETDYDRQSLELKAAGKGAFQITKEAYARHQLIDPFTLPSGRRIAKPANW
jgi:hypothetical protein